MNRNLSLGSLLILTGAAVVGCTGDRCLNDDVDCIVDHMVLVEHQDNGARIELIKAGSAPIEALVPAPPCAGKMCSGSCVNVDVDPNNCGACGTHCLIGQACIMGACACRAGEAVCGNACEDLKSSATNCGACDHACTGPMGASSSSAASSSSSSSSAGSGSSSSSSSGGGGASSSSSSSSSGSSSSSASSGSSSSSASSSSGGGAGGGDGYYCSAGKCVTDCLASEVCGQSCVDKQTDPNNCGDCYHTCNFGETCQAGVCTCTSPPYACGCVDPSTDNANCGACGTACAPDQTCKSGICWPPPPDQNAPLAITSHPIPLVFTEPNVLAPFDLTFRDPNSCEPSLCAEICQGDKCSSNFVCTREAVDVAKGNFRSFVGFLEEQRGSSATVTMQMVPLSAPGCPGDLIDRISQGNLQNVTVGAVSRVPIKIASGTSDGGCTEATNLCGCSLKACSTSDGQCSYEVGAMSLSCGENCNCASQIATAIKTCCTSP